MRSGTATTAINKRPLSSEEACLIIETSAKAGVTELKFGDLHVRFGKPAEQIVGMTIVDPYPVHQAPQSPSVKDLTEEQHQNQTKQAIEAEEIRTREDQLARLLVEDPEAYEKLLRDGELTDAVDDADDGDNDE